MWQFAMLNRLRRAQTTRLPSRSELWGGVSASPCLFEVRDEDYLSRGVAIDGRHHAVGETFDVSDADALAVISMDKAQPKDKPKSGEDRSVGLTTSDAPALVKRGRRK